MTALQPSAEGLAQLGALFSSRRYVEAEAKAREMIHACPNHPTAWQVLAVILGNGRRYAEALPILHRMLELWPSEPETLHNLANTLRELGRLSDAVDYYVQVLKLKPESFSVHGNLGNVLWKLRRLDEAESSMRSAIALRPDSYQGHNGLANVLGEQGRLTEAEASCNRALELNPASHEAHTILGNLLYGSGRYAEAEARFRHALQLMPDYFAAQGNLGNVQLKLRRLDEAEASMRRAIALNPESHKGFIGLGDVLRERGRLTEAEACCRRALALSPDSPEAHTGVGNLCYETGRHAEADEHFLEAMRLMPDFSYAHSNRLFCLCHDERMDAKALFAEHREFALHFETPLRANWLAHANDRAPNRQLHVGFVSGDLRNHAVSYFIEPTLAALGASAQLSLHAYFNFAVEDHVSHRLRSHFAHWNRVAGMRDAELADKIRADGIDILIDLSGHTNQNRMLTFARKAAPVQASWIGYPGTTGLSAMDYFLADRFFLPHQEFDAQFSEKIVHLPAYSSFQPTEGAPTVKAPPALSNGFVTFASFNRQSKIGKSVIQTWSTLMRSVPGSRIVLAALPELQSFEVLAAQFARHGIARERLIHQPFCEFSAYLELHHKIDICLDTFAYTGGTTNLHALWMGVPTLTVAGGLPPRRLGGVIANHAGLSDFVARDADDFVEKGARLAGDLPGLANLRAGLRDRFLSSTMGQPALVASGLERALRIMWQRWCAGLPPEAFDVD